MVELYVPCSQVVTEDHCAEQTVYRSQSAVYSNKMRQKRYKVEERNEIFVFYVRSYRLVKSIAHLFVGLLDNERFAILDLHCHVGL